MKVTVVSYKVDANRKLMLPHKRNSAFGNDRPKNTPHKYNNSHLDVGFAFTLKNGRKKNAFPTRPGRLCYCCYEFNVICSESPLSLKSLTPFLSNYNCLLQSIL